MTRARLPIAAFLATLCLSPFAFSRSLQPPPAEKPAVPGGDLRIIGPGGAASGSCPLKHTDVVANVTGFVGRTKVKQTFHNPLADKIEAVYVFPLPNDAAVDEMVMTVGDRRIVGQVKQRDEARQAYEQAKAAGHVASLLDQERPNVFTQAVANVEPGARVVIEISYVETLKYEDGWFEYVFPMVVGPRYMPGTSAGKQGEGFAPDTTQVPDASKISPVPTPPGTRAGHDISLTLHVNAGVPLQGSECRSHPIVTDAPKRPEQTKVWLKNEQTIPNKDFIYRYRTAGRKIEDALLTHKDGRGSFFTLVLQPPEKVTRKDAVGRELVFVLDTSGSMQGFPITQAKFVMSKAIDSMGPQDTFNLITFSGDTNILWDEPRPNTPENREAAQAFLDTRKGGGGTEMMKAIDAALVKTKLNRGGGPEPVRMVCFMTDGYVGNDMAIVDAVKKNAGTTRVFSFGVGSSVNRFLLDGMAMAGRGEVEYVTLESKAHEAAERFYQRIDAPVLTDVTLDFGDLPVADVYPRLIPDLFSNKPILVHGRLKGDWKDGAAVTLRGNTAAGAFERKVAVKPAAADASHEALASLWARSKVTDLMMRDLAALQVGNFPEELKTQVTALGTEFRLMTQFTSFVAVEEMTITKGGVARKIAVPVEMPDGVSYEGVFGEGRKKDQIDVLARGRGMQLSAAYGRVGSLGGGVALQQQDGAIRQLGRGVNRYGLQPGQAAPPVSQPAAAAGVVSGPATPMPALAKSEKLAEERERVVATDGHLGDVQTTTADPADPAEKLDAALRGLAEKVEKEGKAGSLAAGGVTVSDFKVDVLVYLSDASEKTREALKQLGFETGGESKTVRLLVGSIDVRKLNELAKLEAVVAVKPVGA